MASTLIDRAPLSDRVTAQAREIHIGRLVLTVLAAVLFAVGWSAGKVVTVVGGALVWSFAAVKVGWNDGRRRHAGSA